MVLGTVVFISSALEIMDAEGITRKKQNKTKPSNLKLAWEKCVSFHQSIDMLKLKVLKKTIP